MSGCVVRHAVRVHGGLDHKKAEQLAREALISWAKRKKEKYGIIDPETFTAFVDIPPNPYNLFSAFCASWATTKTEEELAAAGVKII